MSFTHFLIFIFGVVILNEATAENNKNGVPILQVSQRMEDVLSDVKQILNNPAIQKVMSVHTQTRNMIKESFEMTKKLLKYLAFGSEKAFKVAKCIGQVKGRTMTNLRDKVNNFIKCDFDLIKANEALAAQWIQQVHKVATESHQSIQKAAQAFLQCPENSTALLCLQTATLEIWKLLKTLSNTVPNQIVKPGLTLGKNIGLGVYKCKSTQLKSVRTAKNEVLDGLSQCWNEHIRALKHNRPTEPEEVGPSIAEDS